MFAALQTVSEEFLMFDEDMIGQRIDAIDYNKDGSAIKIHTDKGVWTLTAEGDCCSSSFFVGWDGYLDLIGKVITNIDNRQESGAPVYPDQECTQEVPAWYGGYLFCGTAHAYLEMRNDSNGYYGGSCVSTFTPHA